MNYDLLISRLDKLSTLSIVFEETPRTLKEIQVIDREKALKALGV
jgi:hypothetical protein